MLPGPGERTLLVAGELACELGAFAFDGDTLEFITRVSTVGSLAVDPDGVAGAPLASVAMPGVSYVEVEAG